MNAINNSILTLILLTPLAGAVLVAVLPDRVKLPNWITLLTTLLTFVFTLHLPAHFISGQGGFQFEINRQWITNPAIFYHVGVDALSMWLVVLTGLLAPIGVLASWKAIETRRKIFYSLFLVQQTAMFGVFISLDLMLYYGFWELSLVPMAILIAMYGRKDGPRAALKFFLFTFIPSAPLLVAILWLYSRTGTFDFASLAVLINHGSLPAGGLWWCALAFLFAFAVKVPVFPIHGWIADTFSEAPVALAMVVAGKLGLYSMLRFHAGLFPVQARALAPLMIALAVIGILYGACLALAQRDFWRGRGRAVPAAGRDREPLRHQPDRCVWRARGQSAAPGFVLRHCLAGHGRTAALKQLCGRVPYPVKHVYPGEPRLGRGRRAGRDSGRGLHALAGAADFLRQ